MRLAPSRSRHPARRRIGIIGAGPGGLAAAMLLARAGADVTLFERLDRVGGRSGTILAETGAGSFRFDMGPTFFLYPRVLADIFADCDHDLNAEVEMIRLDPQYDLVFEQGGRVSASSNLDRLTAEIARLSPADAHNLPRFMAENRAKLAAFRPILERNFASFADWLSPSMLRALPLFRPFLSVDRDLARHFADPRVRLAFSFQTKYLGMSPFRCPSLFTILAFIEYEYGVWHPVGGCGSVMEAMARVARRMGARIRLRELVQEILFEGRRAVGVRTHAGEQRFDALVVNADFADVMTKLVPDALRRRWTDRKIRRKKFSCSTFMLYLGLEGRLDEVAHHTIFLARDYRRNIKEIESGAPVSAPSFYVQNACVTDDTLAPPGCSTLYMLIPVGNLQHKDVDWAASQIAFRRVALDRLKAIGVEDVERRIVFEKIVTPAGWRDDMAIHHGATFNLSHTLGQMLHMRPQNRFEDLEGVYLVGGGTHPGSGLPGRPGDLDGARVRAIRARGGGVTASRPVGVIGGGLGGLAAACTLAARGHRVVLFEKNEWLGGKAAVLDEGGFRFDMGPTILTVPDVLARIFAEAGVCMSERLDLRRIAPQWRCFFDDAAVLDLHDDVAASARAIAAYSPGDEDGFRDFIALSKRLHGISERFFFWKSVEDLRDTMDMRKNFDLATIKDVLALRMGRTVASTIRSRVRNARVAQMLDHFVQYVGSSPYGAPAVLCSIAHMQTDGGVWYPMGGTRAVPRALQTLAEQMGVDIRINQGVRRIVTEAGQVAGVETDAGETVPFAAVVSNMDSVRTNRELVGGTPAASFGRRWKREPACSGVVLYLGLDRAYDHLAHHNFVFSRDAEEEFNWIYRRGEPAPDPTCYLAAPSRTEPSVAPPGGEALYVLVHTPWLRPHHDWSEILPRYRQTIFEKLARSAGLTDLEDRIVVEHHLTPQDIHERYRVLNGAIYGLASHGRFFGAFKPGNRSRDLAGLYLAGGAAHPGPGMPMVLMSGWIAADALDADLSGGARRRA